MRTHTQTQRERDTERGMEEGWHKTNAASIVTDSVGGSVRVRVRVRVV